MQQATWGRLLAELPAQLRGEVLFQVFFRHHPVSELFMIALCALVCFWGGRMYSWLQQ